MVVNDEVFVNCEKAVDLIWWQWSSQLFLLQNPVHTGQIMPATGRLPLLPP